ncbi:DUF1737 domain-containing protein [Streptomyces spinosus]|uniref:DUF1737 domain-containing protein n=1 Tax=Streptomyces spinosus TaxID=2872623 RepID=UPI003FD6F707
MPSSSTSVVSCPTYPRPTSGPRPRERPRLSVHRVLTGPDDAASCHRVSEATALGYELHEGPAVILDGERVIVAQAVVRPAQS